MKLKFNKVPKPAVYCYLIGFIILTVAFAIYTFELGLISSVTNIQIFIVGAIIIVIGSVINTLYQFRKRS